MFNLIYLDKKGHAYEIHSTRVSEEFLLCQ